MFKFIKRLTDLSFVSNVLQNPAQYTSTENGFYQDQKKLQSDVNQVVAGLNHNIKQYGNQEYASQS